MLQNLIFCFNFLYIAGSCC